MFKHAKHWSACHEQLAKRLKQGRQCCRDVDLATVLGLPVNFSLLKSGLQLDHPEGMINIRAGMSFGRLDLILQLSVWSIK